MKSDVDTERRLDWVMVLLVALIVITPAIAIATANWTDGLDTLWLAALFGSAVGVLISVSRFRSLIAHLLSLVYSLTWIGWLLMMPLASLSLREKIIDVFLRVSGWIALAARGGTGRDPMSFVVLMGLLPAWWIAYVAMWNTVRHQRIWLALLPAGLALFVNYFYYVGSSKLAFYLIVYMMCAFLVIVRSYTLLQEHRWTKERIGYNSDVRYDLLRWGTALASAAILFAWVAPTAATSEQAYELWRHVEGPWRGVEENFNRIFSTLRSQARSYGNPFGRMITLRGPRVLSDTPVLEVAAPSTMRFYWQGVVYDRYTGSSWLNTTDDKPIHLDAPWYQAQMEPYAARQEITETVTMFLPVNTLLFAAPEPVRFSVTAQADAHIIRSAGSAEFTQVIADRTLRTGSTYSAVSSVSIADETMLRTAGIDYPSWVQERYLQLPDSLPDSVRQQARTIAGNLSTPYDKATAIESWLRENVVYDDQTPAPPEDEDGVAYVLSVRRGYCDYYASAMVVMLRSLGIPARLVVGYAQGKYDDSAGVYRVTEKDSHSWVEVFFPKYGWIEFEPTASQPGVARPKPQPSATPSPTSEADQNPPKATRDPRDFDNPNDPFGPGAFGPLTRQGPLESPLGVIGIAGTIVSLAFVALWVVEQRRSGGLKPARKPSLVHAAEAGEPGKLRRALRFVARLGLRTWLVLLGIVELIIAFALVLAIALYKGPTYRANTTAENLVVGLAVVGLVEILAIVVMAVTWTYERHGLRGLSRCAQIYARLLRFSNWLHVRWRDSQTPHERGMTFAAAAPAAGEFIEKIVDNYTREQYSPTPPDMTNAEQLWQAASPLLWLAGIRQRWQAIRRRWDSFVIWRDALSRRLNSQFRGG